MKKNRPIEMKYLPKRLKKLRNLKGWSQGQLAKKIGIDPQPISKYERGVIFPTIDMIIKLANAFEVNVDHLLREKEEIDVEGLFSEELIERFQQIDELPQKEKDALIVIMDALINQHNK